MVRLHREFAKVHYSLRLFPSPSACMCVTTQQPLLTCLLTYLLTPRSRVLKKVTSFKLVKKFPAFYGPRSFITAVKISRHLSLSWASSIQSIPFPYPTPWRSILILSLIYAWLNSHEAYLYMKSGTETCNYNQTKNTSSFFLFQVDKNYGTRLTVHAFPRNSRAKFAQIFSVWEMLPTDTFCIKVTLRRVTVEKQQ